MSLLDSSGAGVSGGDSGSVPSGSSSVGAPSDELDRGPSPNPLVPPPQAPAPAPAHTPTSAEIDAVIAAAIANAPPAPTPPEIDRSSTPLMTNLLPSAVGADGRVNLFVGNLPYRVRWQDLKDLFRKAGTVLRADVSLGPDNRSRGYGTVLMGSREDAARAIDRFNGFTWQTRTLEVRPDRLPPEYEPQTHTTQHHHAPPRPPMYTYHNMSGGAHAPFSLPGHLTPSGGPSWLPGQMSGQRPPPSHPMHGQMSMPGHLGHGHGLGGHQAPHMGSIGSSPIPHSTSPGSQYGPGGLPLPLSGQTTGTAFHSFGASPLAGSLTAGAGAGGPTPSNSTSISTNGVNSARKNSFTPFSQAIAPDSTDVSQPRSTSPEHIPSQGSSSRPASTGKQSPMKPDAASLGSRAGPPGSLGPLPPPLFAGVKAVISPSTESGHGSETGHSLSIDPTPPVPPPAAAAGAAVTIAMEGLSHQGAHMGPPSTLHDRVVFVSNLPLTMQWQELKDLLRPAGVIIRADVATDVEGRPRGFGTALFATEKDAASAVTMYNDREIAGRKIRVHLERDSIPEALSRRTSVQTSGSPQQETGSALAPIDTSTANAAGPPKESPIAARLPWTLNTAAANGAHATPSRYGGGGPVHHDMTPQHSYRPHHPGPISMPTFAPLDTPGQMNPLSPLQTRGLPPMTPSMPGFIFNAYPETPPVHPHFMSPGSGGPFSPGLPVTSPTGFQYNPFLNPAPGAPVNRFPQSGSAALGTPTTQAFPGNAIHRFGPPGAAPGSSGQGLHQSIGQAVDYFPSVAQQQQQQQQINGGEPLSPSPRLNAAPRKEINPSPLNAKDRLASSRGVVDGGVDDVDKLTEGTKDLAIDSAPGTGPPTPTGQRKRDQSSNSILLGSKGDTGEGGQLGRASLDGSRPTLGVWELGNGERRASFGDIVAGRTG